MELLTVVMRFLLSLVGQAQRRRAPVIWWIATVRASVVFYFYCMLSLKKTRWIYYIYERIYFILITCIYYGFPAGCQALARVVVPSMN